MPKTIAPPLIAAAPSPAPAPPPAFDANAAAAAFHAAKAGKTLPAAAPPSPEPPKPTPAPPPPVAPVPAPAPAPVVPKPEAPKDKPVIPDFKPTTPPAPIAAPVAPPPAPADDIPDLPEHTDPKSPVAVNFGKLREVTKRYQQEAKEAKAQLVELQSKAQQPQAPVVPPDYESLKAEREELTRKLSTYELATNPLFKSAFDQKIEAVIAQATAILPAEHKQAIASVMAMPAGEYRDKQLRELTADLEPMDASTIGAAYHQQRMLELERKQELDNAPATLDKLKARQAEVKAQDQQRARQQAQLFADQELFIASEKFDEFRNQAGNDAHNAKVKANQELVREWMGFSEWQPDTRAKLAVWAVRGINSVETEMALRGEVQQLQAQLKALSSAQPNPIPAGGATTQPEVWTPESGARAFDQAKGRR